MSMAEQRNEVRRLGSPTDRLIAIYALVSGMAFAFPHRPADWAALAVLHVMAAVIGFGLPPARQAWDAAGRQLPRVIGGLHDWYPLLLVPPLYSELQLLNRSVWGGVSFDSIVQGWEQAIFGTQPSRALAAALPFPPLSELLHFGYLSYYLLIVAPPLLIWFSGRHAAFRTAIFALMLTYAVHYMFYIWFPVLGPRTLFPAPGGALAQGPFYRLTHALLEAGSSAGSAFPSSHVGIAVAQTIVARRFLPRWWPVFAFLVLCLAAGTVYGGFHYAIDAIAGAALGAACVAAAFPLYDRMARVRRPAPGAAAAVPVGP
jgi:membrane-associated phospholipid phosphatase